MTAQKKDLATELIDDLLQTEVSEPQPMAPSKPNHTPSNPEKTEKLNESKLIPMNSQKSQPVAYDSSVSVRTTVGRYRGRSPLSSGGSALGATEAALAQSENHRIAQQRIIDLENEVERLRRENEALAAAGEILRRIADESKIQIENFERRFQDQKENFQTEKDILTTSLQSKDRELKEAQAKVQEYEMRLSSNLQKIRVRERELENRLELIRMENTAVVRSKDELLLDYKRRIDQAQAELDNYRQKSQDIHKIMTEKQELMKRTVKALRLALSMLESETDASEPHKK